MTLDETIKLFEKMAKEYAEKSKATIDVMEMVNLPILDKALNEFIVAETNKQVAEWLKELKAYRETFQRIGKKLSEKGYTEDDLKKLYEEVNADAEIHS